MTKFHNIVQMKIDQIHEETSFHSNPSKWMKHPLMVELLLMDREALTPVLLEMLWHDPNWVIMDALWALHRPGGPQIPEEHKGRFYELCGHWNAWGVARGYLGPVEDLETTEEGTPL